MLNSQFVNEFPDRYAAIFSQEIFFFNLGKIISKSKMLYYNIEEMGII